jgi:cytoskeletal protein CcmA (bactofilin family)
VAEKDLTGFGELQALLGQGTRFEGTLAFEGRIRVDGYVRGKVVSEGVLVLGPTADIDAIIEVGTLIVRGGTVRGEVTAKRLVEVYSPSKVLANVRTAQLFLDKGASFDGTCTMLESTERVSRESGDPT